MPAHVAIYFLVQIILFCAHVFTNEPPSQGLSAI